MARIATLDQAIRKQLEAFREPCLLLQTIPGIDEVSAGAILAEIGPDLQAFGSPHRLAAWAGLCPGNNESAGKRRSCRTRSGSKTLRAVLAECAHGAARTRHCQFYGYHRVLTARRGYKRALIATAHKMLRTLYAVLRDRKPYRDPGADYEARIAAICLAPRHGSPAHPRSRLRFIPEARGAASGRVGDSWSAVARRSPMSTPSAFARAA